VTDINFILPCALATTLSTAAFPQAANYTSVEGGPEYARVVVLHRPVREQRAGSAVTGRV
jgi:hypothetical protein